MWEGQPKIPEKKWLGFALVIIKGLWERKNMCFVVLHTNITLIFFYNDTDDVPLAFAIN